MRLRITARGSDTGWRYTGWAGASAASLYGATGPAPGQSFARMIASRNGTGISLQLHSGTRAGSLSQRSMTRPRRGPGPAFRSRMGITRRWQPCQTRMPSTNSTPSSPSSRTRRPITALAAKPFCGRRPSLTSPPTVTAWSRCRRPRGCQRGAR